MSDERITVRVQLKDAAKFIADAKASGHEIEVLGNKARKASKDAKPFSSELDKINKLTKALRPAAFVAGIGIIGQVLATGATGGVAFTAALVPAVGLLGTLPALAAGAGQGLGVLALSVHGVKDAMGGLNGQIDPKKFALLSRPAQDFALYLDTLRPRIKSLQADTQAGLFPGLTAGLKSASPALNALHGPLVGTATIFGAMGARLGALVGSKGFLTDLHQQAEFNNVQFVRLGGAGLHVVNMFRNLMVVSRPLVGWMVQLVSGWAEAADHAVALGRGSGSLGRTFHSVQVTAGRLVHIGGDLAMVLWNIGKIGKHALGDELLVSLEHGSDALRQWTESGPGIQKITGFFTDAKPVIYASAHLLGDVATQLLRFGAGSSGGIVGILGTFDSMVKIVGTLSTLVGPDTVVYAFLAGKTIATGLKTFQALQATIIATKGATAALAATSMASTIKNGIATALTTATLAAGSAGAIAGRAYGLAFRAGVLAVPAAIISIGANQLAKGSKFGTTGKDYGGGALGSVISTLNNIGTAPLTIGSKALHALGIHGKRAMGGPVWPGNYLVGERGPEVLSIGSRGWVTPNHELGRGPRSSAPSAGGGAGMAGLLERLVVEVRPQAINLDGQPIGEVVASVAVKHENRR